MVNEIIETKKLFQREEKIKKILLYQEREIPIVIHGNGLLAETTKQYLKEKGIIIKKNIVASGYKYSDNDLLLSECLNSYKEIVVIIAVASPILVDKYKLQYRENSQVLDVFYLGDNYPADVSFLEKEYLIEKTNELEQVYSLLEDQLSKEAMYNFLCAKISGDSKYLNYCNVVDLSGEEYFNKIFSWKDKQIVVDGGAYDGDTYREFLLQGIDYKKYVAFEPDDKNYVILKENLENDNKVELFKCGLWSKKESLYFKAFGSMSSRIVESNGSSDLLKVMDVDSVVPDATFIKMDIEGSEYEALKGAKNTIIRNKPKLAICCYHRIEDIWRIPLYIKEICPEYHIFFRLHEKNGVEI